MEDRAIAVERQFIEALETGSVGAFIDNTQGWDHRRLGLSDAEFVGIFESQLKSR